MGTPLVVPPGASAERRIRLPVQSFVPAALNNRVEGPVVGQA
jgi:hypothetical protein